MKRIAYTAILLVLGGWLFLRHCSGPRPRLVSAAMHGPIAEAVVLNEARGNGEIDVKFTVVGHGARVVKSERVELAGEQEIRVRSRIEGARGDEKVEAEVDYPPR